MSFVRMIQKQRSVLSLNGFEVKIENNFFDKIIDIILKTYYNTKYFADERQRKTKNLFFFLFIVNRFMAQFVCLF